MGKFDQTNKEKFVESRELDKRLFKFALGGSVFTLLYFAIANLVNPLSKAVNLASVALILIVLVSWVYWAVVKSWTIYYLRKNK